MTKAIAFAEAAEGSRGVLERTRDLLRQHPSPAADWEARLDQAQTRLNGEGTLTLALVGQFNAGKSSLIAALTGADVQIDADVATTEVTPYAWRNVVLLDTPGVHADVDATPHDELSREATGGADLVLFVVTAELFNDRLAAHFRWIAGPDGLGLSPKMAVVVNKMDRETNDESVIREQIALAISPYDDVSIFACSARSAIDARLGPEPLRERAWRRSNFESLVSGIDGFVSEHGLAGRLSTPLQMVEEVVAEAMVGLTADESAERRAAQLLQRKRKALDGATRAIEAALADFLAQLRTAAATAGERCVRAVKDDATKTELEQTVHVGLDKLDGDLEALQDKLCGRIRTALDEATAELEELGRTPLGAAVDADERLRAEREALTVDMRKVGDSRMLKKAADAIGKPLRDGLKKLADDPELLRDGIYKLGKAVGKKFKPWEAVRAGEKLAVFAERLGQAAPFVAVAVDAYFSYRAEVAEDERRAQLARARTAVHRTFSDHAERQAEALRAWTKQIREDSVGRAIAEAEQAYQEVCAGQTSASALAAQLGELLNATRRLRERLFVDS
jgi:GTPase SAR1 family protein